MRVKRIISLFLFVLLGTYVFAGCDSNTLINEMNERGMVNFASSNERLDAFINVFYGHVREGNLANGKLNRQRSHVC